MEANENAGTASSVHPTLNRGLDPDAVAPSSRKQVWWQCGKGHPYRATPANRVYNDQSCPVCLNRVIHPRANDFATALPHLAAEWHPSNDASPTTLGVGSTSEQHWLCAEGHLERTPIYRRIRTGCTQCAAATKAAERSIADTHPEIAAEWNIRKNEGATPAQFTAGSRRFAYWICENGHAYGMRIQTRTSGGGCPFCAHRKLLPGFNDFATTDPELAAEWHPRKNMLQPVDTMGSDRPFWWLCTRAGHEVRQTIAHRRASRGCTSCPQDQRARPASA
ncbi:zinc-ribbon domain-containing protein [Salinibacterium sp. ZJ77]|uniref:zinc-ribbon domain-containing protein n=1 Tax=Salinibacterium sp. ZJ77 TaxID=2708337 RepID=UPI00141E7FBE|nr:zinc-ribbon domain-containing protein [Salinibacterium sp. ZJ77]